MEGSAAVVSTGLQEIRQNIVGIGCADQLAHRQAQLLCQPAGQNIAEVTGGNTEVDLITHLDLATSQQVCISLEIVSDLGCQTADVNGVCGRQTALVACRQFTVHSGSKDILHAGLGIVKVAVYSADSNILAFLGDHLGALNGRNTSVRVKDADLYALYIRKAGQSSLTGVAGSRSQNQNILFHSLFFLGCGEQLGQHTQGHILKGGCGATEQLQNGKLTGIHSRGQLCGLELAGVGTAYQFFHVGNIGQHGTNDHGCHTHGIFCKASLGIKCRKFLGHIKAAVGSKAA